ncbi:unnamed protein product [Heligmosomoides polygyrus]|uniref:Lysozyme n=2 Tax=Heligmosomoides polygyrus TaxID=6339 RepID=A0A3P8BYY6_HELPZ|nr:lysozyme-3 [Heligmosomoides bakeri]VDO81398.1 unnamed protein product [Heligmosomoides polygyrus]
MRTIVALSTLVLCCLASPVVQQTQQHAASELATVAYALDLAVPVTTSTFQCMRQNLYNVAFIRAYSPSGQGQIDAYACANIQNANAAGLGTEVYMTPQPNSAKTGAQQFDEMYSNLRNSNINVRSVWVQVTSPVNWFSTSSSNVNFLNSILSRAGQYGLTVGIYTSVYDWNQITGGATVSNAMLWYWNVYGSGPSNETPPNFSDFRAFGGWTSPSVKQFGQVESVCGTTVNRDVYLVSSASAAGMAKYEKSEQLVVGGLGLGSALFNGQPEIKA